jgi:hypothetical protein
MTITFPINLPSTPRPSQLQWLPDSVVAVSRSPFNGKSQVQEYTGDRWLLSVALPPMERDKASPWFAAMNMLRGRRGTFLFGSYLWGTPEGTAAGTPLVKGASQSGLTLITDGWTPGSAILKAGDMFQIDNSLYQNVTDVSANGSGEATLDIWPRLRGHADNSSIVTNYPKGIFRLRENSRLFVELPSKHFQLSFEAEEAL